MFLIGRDTQLTGVTLSPLLNQSSSLTSISLHWRLFHMLLRLVLQVSSAEGPRGGMPSNKRASRRSPAM